MEKFCSYKNMVYFCNVFFIVLDLRLTRLVYGGTPFFLPITLILVPITLIFLPITQLLCP